MPTVVIASPKGGAGKSTTAVLLGTELAHAGANVVMLDCDPNQSLTLWSDRGPLPERITVLSSVSKSRHRQSDQAARHRRPDRYR